jgi:hypothetical protein
MCCLHNMVTFFHAVIINIITWELSFNSSPFASLKTNILQTRTNTSHKLNVQNTFHFYIERITWTRQHSRLVSIPKELAEKMEIESVVFKAPHSVRWRGGCHGLLLASGLILSCSHLRAGELKQSDVQGLVT